MAKLICKITHSLTSFRISLPLVIVRQLGWESCKYVTAEANSLGDILIRRLPGDEKRNNESSKHLVDVN